MRVKVTNITSDRHQGWSPSSCYTNPELLILELYIVDTFRSKPGNKILHKVLNHLNSESLEYFPRTQL